MRLLSLAFFVLLVAYARATDCENECGENEEYTECLPCPPGSICPAVCLPGCVCKAGYYRGECGNCIPVPECNNSNEEFKFGTCNPSCEDPNNEKCKKNFSQTCFCKDGTVIGPSGQCIPLEECPKECGKNEEFRSDYCDEKCPGIPKMCPLRPNYFSCWCIEGTVRNTDNQCVCPDECKPICGENEEYKTSCGGTCENPDIQCINPTTECHCIDGYVRNIDNKCVLLKQCPAKCGCDEEYRYGFCDGTCEQPNCIPPNVRLARKLACFCKEGHVRDSNNKCIPEDKCPPKCKPNEVFNPCVGYCSFDLDCARVINGIIRDCAAPPEDYKCPSRCECKPGLVRIDADCVPIKKCCKDPNETLVDCPSKCDDTCVGDAPKDCELTPCAEKGCRCKKGFVRGATGTCIPRSKCPKCEGPNESYTECGSCDGTCDNPSPICTTECKVGCFCNKGYVRDNGICTLLEKCPKKCKGQNEEYKQGTCNPTCDMPVPMCRKAITWGCYCKDGFVANDKGVCIPKSQCPKKCKGKNEEYRTGTCDPTCDEPNRQCKIKNHDDCFCLKGFVRNSENVCVSLDACPKKCKGQNEEYKMGTCNPTCAQPVPVCKKKPTLGCYCKDGFVEDNGLCVPKSVCDKKKCGKNEEYTECIPCPPGKICAAVCRPGCVCIKGFYKEDGGKCSKIPDCEKNSEFKYGTCNPTCDMPIPMCKKALTWGCYCKDGFVANEKGVCIAQSKCPKKCKGQNEEYRTGTCDPTCEEPNRQCRIKDHDDCFCLEGFVRNSDNVCVCLDDCPSTNCDDDEEDHDNDDDHDHDDDSDDCDDDGGSSYKYKIRKTIK